MGHKSVASGFGQVADDTAAPTHTSWTSSAGEDSSGYESSVSSFANNNTCTKSRGMKCTKSCCKGKGKAKDRRVKIVTSSEAESSDNTGATKSADEEIAASVQLSSNLRKNQKSKGKAVQFRSETEDESSAQTGEASTGLDTAVKYTNPSVVDPNWSISEDYRLRGMKDAGETWKFIASSLCKSMGDVRARWKILQRQTVASETSTGPETSEATTEPETGDVTTEGDSEDATSGVSNGNETTSDNETDDQGEESEETSEDKIQSDNGDNENEQDSSTDDSEHQTEDTNEETNFVPKSKGKAPANSSVKNKWHKGARNRKVAKENKVAKARSKSKTLEQDDSSMKSDEGESGNTSDSPSQLGYDDAERRQQMDYLYNEIYGDMYPADVHPNPDARLSQRDCEILATIDSKYTRSRWLEIQANFCNVTGRMIPLEAIKDKFERAEAEKEARCDARQLKKQMEKVKEWVDDQACRDSDE
ncbi:hypothetical protein FLONG3_10755 [Fusarium longipes]|uniref:Myb-like domain-containing protein n=1 Tax=Fusarium longipes TaxID=694270 RepID=A0A395RLP8_9HYPO|nr:hypothetical protein FLONG3_10755 [Fusarium longipes]